MRKRWALSDEVEADRAGAGGDENDGSLLEELRTVLRQVDPVPARVREAAKASFAWRTVDAELAELAFDSLVDQHQLATVRAAGEPRLLTFTAPGLTVEVEVAASGGRRRLIGQLVPPGAAQVKVRHPGGAVTVDADELGRFTVAEVEPGPVRLQCRVRRAEPVAPFVTDWVSI